MNTNYFKTRVVRYPVLAAAGLAAVVVLGISCELSKADWGTWVGSVGTLGTLIGTILLATSERRNRRNQELALAQVTAASFVERVRVTGHVLEYGVKYLRTHIENPATADLADLHRIKSTDKMWTPEETVPLVALHGKVAMKLSKVSAKFNTVQRNLHAIADIADRLSDSELRGFFIEQIDEYQRILTTLEEVMPICMYAALET